ncbi:hypothetical protein ACFO5X_01045 [Seohaeicola nanhaiensis]|uniref:Uncharacterized protein n=1 Tax=Seohaeicola nanhaiensis TaxID=1387282 RepID=A0ABV9KAB9_9RHOB
MQNHLNAVKQARINAQGIVFESAKVGYPMWAARDGVIWYLKNLARLPVPDDILAFASEGQVSDEDVTDWDAPNGGLELVRV